MRHRRQFLAMVVPLACLAAWGVSRVGVAQVADEPARPEKAADVPIVAPADRGPKVWTTAVEPKPLSRNVKKGLAWLVEHQLPGGGWGEGEESAAMRAGDARTAFRGTPNVADTCVASLALVRSGSTPREGPYRRPIFRGVGYVYKVVRNADAASLSVSSVSGTRAQLKLGPNIDTYMASVLLSEVKGQMPDEATEQAVDLALHKVIGKIERNQRQNGPTEGQGWAPVLAQAMSAKGINRARQAGVSVSHVILFQAENAARLAFRDSGWSMSMDSTRPASEVPGPSAGSYDARRTYEMSNPRIPADAGQSDPDVGPRSMLAGGKGSRSARGRRKPTTGEAAAARGAEAPAGRRGFPTFAAGGAAVGGADGVELYNWAACLGILQDSLNTSNAELPHLRETAAHSADARERGTAKRELAWIADVETTRQAARSAVIERSKDRNFLAGFGSNGGEEFLSYMTIAESLVVQGGDDWKRWDSRMTQSLDRTQNGDGSWSGSHCITGRTFCTSTALLVLMADRTPVPVGLKAEGQAFLAK